MLLHNYIQEYDLPKGFEIIYINVAVVNPTLIFYSLNVL